jgi:hypothetical protein
MKHTVLNRQPVNKAKPAVKTASPASPVAASDEAAQTEHRIGIVRHLIAVMMLGQMYEPGDDVNRVFRALSTMLGDETSLKISLVFASAMAGNPAPARELLAEMEGDPNADMGIACTALALKVAGSADWPEVVDKILAISSDENARQFARQILETKDD